MKYNIEFAADDVETLKEQMAEKSARIEKCSPRMKLMREVKRLSKQLGALDPGNQEIVPGQYAGTLHQVCKFSRNPFESSRGAADQAQHWSQTSTVSQIIQTSARGSTSMLTRGDTSTGAGADTTRTRERYKTQSGFSPRRNQGNDSTSATLVEDSYRAASQLSSECYFGPRTTKQSMNIAFGRTMFSDRKQNNRSQLLQRNRGQNETDRSGTGFIQVPNKGSLLSWEQHRQIISQLTGQLAETPVGSRRLPFAGNRRGYVGSGSLKEGDEKESKMGREGSSGTRQGAIEQLADEKPMKESPNQSRLGLAPEHAVMNTGIRSSRFMKKSMTQQEYAKAYVHEQRQHMIEQSRILEAENLKGLAQLRRRAAQESRAAARTSMAFATDLGKEKGALPQLSQLRSKGNTLRERLKHYNLNLAAIETPVLDELADTVQGIRQLNIKLDLNTRARSRQSQLDLPATKSQPSAVNALATGAALRDAPGRPSDANAVSSGGPPRDRRGSSEAFKVEAEDGESQPSCGDNGYLNYRNNYLDVGIPKIEAPKREAQLMQKGTLTKGRIQEPRKKNPVPAVAMSKDQIKHVYEECKRSRQRVAEREGTRMDGCTGGLDLIQVVKMQEAQIRSQILIEHEKQVDQLVYRQLESDDRQERGSPGAKALQEQGFQASEKRHCSEDYRRASGRDIRCSPLGSKLEQKRRSQISEILRQQPPQLENRPEQDSANSPAGPPLLAKEQAHVYNLSMLESQQPRPEERQKQEQAENKALLYYAEGLRTSLQKPQPKACKRKKALKPSRFEDVQIEAIRESPGGSLFAEQLEKRAERRRKEAEMLARPQMAPQGRQWRLHSDAGDHVVREIRSRSSLIKTDESWAAEEADGRLCLQAGHQSVADRMRAQRASVQAEARPGGSRWLEAPQRRPVGTAALATSDGRLRGPAGEVSKQEIVVSSDNPYRVFLADSGTGDVHIEARNPRMPGEPEAVQLDDDPQLDDQDAIQSKELANQITEELVQKLKRIKQKRKFAIDQSSAHLSDEQPLFAFFGECLRQLEADIPIFEGQLSNSLMIKSQKLGTGHCEAISKAFKVLNRRGDFNHFSLRENGLLDEQLSIIIDGLESAENLKSFESVKNAFQLQSLAKLLPILEKTAPFQLRELRLVDCKLSSGITQGILGKISQKCQLDVLCLQKASYNEAAVGHLCDILRRGYLSALDISWSTLSNSASQYLQILEALPLSRHLMDINLSWNNLADDGTSTGKQQRHEVVKGLQANKDQEGAMAHQYAAARCLAKLIKRHARVQHINLENTGLTKMMAEVITAAARKARSVNSIHLSDNPFLLGAGQGLFDEISERVAAKPVLAKIVQGRPDKLMNQPDNTRELLKLKGIQAKREMHDHRLHVADAFWNNQLILQRKLGHKRDLKGAARWELVSDFQKHARVGQPDLEDLQISSAGPKGNGCWMCARERYTLIFWSPSIQEHVQKERQRLQNVHLPAFVENFCRSSQLLDKIQEQQEIDADSKRERASGQLGSQVFPSTSNMGSSNHVRIPDGDSMEPKLQMGLGSVIIEEGDQNPASRDAAKNRVTEMLNNWISKRCSKQGQKGPETSSGARSAPVLYSSSINAWHPTSMRNLGEFCKAVDIDIKREDDYNGNGRPNGESPGFRRLAIDKQISRTSQSYEHRYLSDEERVQQEALYRSRWMTTIEKSLRYRQPHLVNADLALKVIENTDSKEPVYVLPVFLKPGKHSFLVSSGDGSGSGDSDHTLQTMIVDAREEQVPIYAKPRATVKGQEQGRVFRKEHSVFSAWQQDTPKSYAACLEDDFVHWKGERIVSDPAERAKIKGFFSSNDGAQMERLRELQVTLQADSPGYPGIAMETLSTFCYAIGLIDNKKPFNKEAMTNAYICSIRRDAARDEGGEEKPKPKILRASEYPDCIVAIRGMLRHDLMEFCVRVCQCKLMCASGGFNDIEKALQHLFSEILPHAEPHVRDWQGFRDKELWTLEINDCLNANLDGLRKVYQCYVVKPRKFMNYSDALRFMGAKGDGAEARTQKEKDMKPTSPEAGPSDARQAEGTAPFTRDARSPGQAVRPPAEQVGANTSSKSALLNLTEKQARLCYALCRQTVTYEQAEGVKYYDRLVFAEFLELLGRMAAIRFQGTEFESEPLLRRLECIVDAALGLVGMERADPAAGGGEDSGDPAAESGCASDEY